MAKTQIESNHIALTAHAQQNRSIRIESVICKLEMHSDQSSIDGIYECMNRHYMRILIKLPLYSSMAFSVKLLKGNFLPGAFFSRSQYFAAFFIVVHFRIYSQLVLAISIMRE